MSSTFYDEGSANRGVGRI